MRIKYYIVVILISIILSPVYSLTVHKDSLKFILGKLDIRTEKDDVHDLHISSSKIISETLYEVSFKSPIYDPYYIKEIPFAEISTSENRLVKIYKQFFEFPTYGDKYKSRIYSLSDQNLLLSLISDVHGFERKFYALCFWEIRGDYYTLLEIVDEPLSVSIGGIKIIDCLKGSDNNYFLILLQSGGDAGDFWGSYKVYKFDLTYLDSLIELYDIQYGGNPKEYSKIENFEIDKTNPSRPIMKFHKYNYKSDSEEEFPKDHRIIGIEGFEIDIFDLIWSN